MEKNIESSQGGYMRSLHTLEEKLYSPEFHLSGASAYKVLLYIRHNTVRWDRENAHFTYQGIAKACGISERLAKKVVKELEEKDVIQVTRTKLGKKDLKNQIGLNPLLFGDLVEKTCKPKLSVIEGGVSEKLSTGVSHGAPTPVSYRAPLGCPIEHPERTQDGPSEPEPGLLKNPLKEQYKKLLSKIPDNFNSFDKSEAEIIEESKEKFRRQRMELGV